MSPYIRAYEAGIKLAQLEWMSKVANPSTERDDYNFTDPDDVAPEAAPTQPIDLDFTEDPEFIQAGTVQEPAPEYFTTRGGYGSMASNLRDYYQTRMDNLYDNTELTADEFDKQMDMYSDRMDQLGDVTGRELSQIYGNQMFQAGDQLNMGDMLSRLDALRDKDTGYNFGGVDVQRGGKTVNLSGRRQAPRGGSRAVAQAPAANEIVFGDNEGTDIIGRAPAAPAPQNETAQQLVARLQANPGRNYENVVMPTMDARSAPTANYLAPSGRGDLGGMVSGTGMQVQGGRTGVQGRRAVADNSARLQGLRRSLASNIGQQGQSARLQQVGQLMQQGNLPSVTLDTSRGARQFSQQGIQRQRDYAAAREGRGSTQAPAVASKSMGAPTAAPQFNPSQGMMGNVMAQNRQVKSAPTRSMPNFPNFLSQQGATQTAVTSKKPEYKPLASMTPAKDQSYALGSMGLRQGR